MIIDTHAHYDDEQFDEDREEILGKMQDAGIGMIMDAGSTILSWDKIVKLTEEYPFVYGAIGVHPDEVGNLDETQFARMERLLDKEKIKAVGEIGLDYYWDKENHDLQKEWVYQTARSCTKKRETGHYPQQGGCRRYDGDYETTWAGLKRCDSLLFLFERNGSGVCENGILYRRRRSGDFQKCKEAQRDSAGDSTYFYRIRN